MLPLSLILTLFVALSQAAEVIDCQTPFKLGQDSFDLSKLSGEHVFDTTVSTPPTTTKTTYSISLCGPLPPPASSIPEGDSCPIDTSICMITRAIRPNHEDVVISVVPIAQTKTLRADLVKDEKDASSKGWVLKLKGGEYNSVKQSAEVLMYCDVNAKDSQPTFEAYDPLAGLLSLKWTTDAACATDGKTSPPPSTPPQEGDEEKKPASKGRGTFGWIMILLFLGVAAYFILGTYNNYTQYGATGWDAIPHRDVWRDLPYVIGDLFKGRGSTRSGYSSLG